MLEGLRSAERNKTGEAPPAAAASPDILTESESPRKTARRRELPGAADALRPPICADQLLLLFGDDFFLDAGRDAAVLGEFHREGPLALASCCAGRSSSRMFRPAALPPSIVAMCPVHLGRDDQAAAAGQFAGHRTLILGRHFDFDLHDRLEQHRLGLQERFAEAAAGTDLEGHVRAVDIVVRAVFEDRLDADDREFGRADP